MHASPPALLALALSLCACATSRKDLGEVDVKSDPPLLNTQIITSYGFHVEEGRIFLTRPGRGGSFDFVLVEGGCLRGILSQRLQEYCRKPSLPGDEPGTERWRNSTSPSTFTTQVTPDGTVVEVEVGLNKVAFVVGDGPAAEELRKHPALLGLAVVFGQLPAANGKAEDATRDFKFIVAQVDDKKAGK